MFSRNAPIRPRKLPKWWGQRVSEAAPFRNRGLEWKSPCARRRNSPKLPPEDRAGTDPPSSDCLLSQADPAWSIGTLALDVEDLVRSLSGAIGKHQKRCFSRQNPYNPIC